MIKRTLDEVWAFDCEWAPDALTGRMAYNLPDTLSDRDVIQTMWEKGGATPEKTQPYLKPVLCRVVSIAVLRRSRAADKSVNLSLQSFPAADDSDSSEGALLGKFLKAIGKAKPQLVGFNSRSSDLPILVQRSLVNGLSTPQFCSRPEKPWDGIDYHAKGSDWNIDLMEELAPYGRPAPSLHEIATACGIPGKIDTDGSNVVDLWITGDLRKIIQYNECDAITTYLLWLRVAHMCGHVDLEQFNTEQRQLEEYLEARTATPGNEHLTVYLDRWRKLRELSARRHSICAPIP